MQLLKKRSFFKKAKLLKKTFSVAASYPSKLFFKNKLRLFKLK
jgi:hypothetical protein